MPADRLMCRLSRHHLKPPIGSEQSDVGCSFRYGPNVVFETFQEGIGIKFSRGTHWTPVSTAPCSAHSRSLPSAAVPPPSCERRHSSCFTGKSSEVPPASQRPHSLKTLGSAQIYAFASHSAYKHGQKLLPDFQCSRGFAIACGYVFTKMKNRHNKSILHGNPGQTHMLTHTTETKGSQNNNYPDSA